jgi:hypothetical protein
VADGPQSVIAEQVRHGLPIRMALIHRALEPVAGPRKSKVKKRGGAA